MSSPTLSPVPASPTPAARWDGHACAYMDLMLELARIGTTIALKLDALGGDLPLLEQASKFNEVSRSVRLCAQLAYKLAQPLPAKPLPAQPAPAESARKSPVSSQPAPPERRDSDLGERGDKEARETEQADRLEDPAREHNLDRPMPELVREIKRGLDAGALPGCTLRDATEEAISQAIRMAAREEARGLNGAGSNSAGSNSAGSNSAGLNGGGLNRAARRALARQPRGHPSG